MTTRSQLSSRNVAHGESFEALLVAACQRYDQRAECKVVKVPTPTRQVGKSNGATFTAVRTAAATCDFLGVLPNGRAIAVEAKSTAGRTLPASKIQPQQAAWLDACAPMAFVVVEFRDAQQVRLVPWADFGKSATVESGWQVSPLDFLRPVLIRKEVPTCS